jgi:hypothetical protein
MAYILPQREVNKLEKRLVVAQQFPFPLPSVSFSVYFTSVIIAIAVGFLLGAILTSR